MDIDYDPLRDGATRDLGAEAKRMVRVAKKSAAIQPGRTAIRVLTPKGVRPATAKKPVPALRPKRVGVSVRKSNIRPREAGAGPRQSVWNRRSATAAQRLVARNMVLNWKKSPSGVVAGITEPGSLAPVAVLAGIITLAAIFGR